MKSSPWVKWFSADFLNGISDLEPNEIAVYSVVLNLIYDSEGPIVDDAVKIGRRCNMRQTSAEKALTSLAAAGKIIRVDGKITNLRCEKEIKSRQKVSEKSSEIANTRWKKQAEKSNKINDASMPTHAPSIATEMLSLSLKPETEKKEVEATPLLGDSKSDGWPVGYFETWYAAYPRKKHPDTARKALASVRKSGRIPWLDLLAATRRFAAEPHDPKFTPYPATWLNAGSWADEPDCAPRHPFAANGSRSPSDEVSAAIMRKLDRQNSERREAAGRDEAVTIIPPANGGIGRSAADDHGRQAPRGRDEDTGHFAFSLPASGNLGWR